MLNRFKYIMLFPFKFIVLCEEKYMPQNDGVWFFIHPNVFVFAFAQRALLLIFRAQPGLKFYYVVCCPSRKNMNLLWNKYI